MHGTSLGSHCYFTVLLGFYAIYLSNECYCKLQSDRYLFFKFRSNAVQ